MLLIIQTRDHENQTTVTFNHSLLYFFKLFSAEQNREKTGEMGG